MFLPAGDVACLHCTLTQAMQHASPEPKSEQLHGTCVNYWYSILLHGTLQAPLSVALQKMLLSSPCSGSNLSHLAMLMSPTTSRLSTWGLLEVLVPSRALFRLSSRATLPAQGLDSPSSSWAEEMKVARAPWGAWNGETPLRCTQQTTWQLE